MQREEITTYDTLIWRGITCRVCTIHNWRIIGWSVITLRYPADVPFPIGVRGYLRHGLEQQKLEAAGGGVAFFKAWADQQAHSPAYLDAVARQKQRDLFGYLPTRSPEHLKPIASARPCVKPGRGR